MSLITVDYNVCELRTCTHGIVPTEYVPNVSRYRHRICLTYHTWYYLWCGSLLLKYPFCSWFVLHVRSLSPCTGFIIPLWWPVVYPHTRFCSKQWITVWLVIFQAIIFTSSKQFTKLKPWNFLNQVTFQTGATSTYCTTVLTPLVACQQVCLWRLLLRQIGEFKLVYFVNACRWCYKADEQTGRQCQAESRSNRLYTYLISCPSVSFNPGLRSQDSSSLRRQF